MYLSPYTIMGLYLAFSLYEQFSLQIPSCPYPTLTFSQSVDATEPRSTVQVCLTGISI